MLIRYYFKHIYFFAPYILLIVFNPIIEAKSNIVSSQMMDYASNGNFNSFLSSLGIVLLIFLMHGLFLFLIQLLKARLIKNARENLRKDMFHCTLASFSDEYRSPDVGLQIAAFSNDITILEYKYFDSWLVVCESIVAIFVSASAILSLNFKLALVILVGEIFSVLICLIAKKYSIQQNKKYIEKLGRFTQRVKDYFSAFSTIHNYSVEQRILERFSIINKETESSKDDADISLSFINTLAKICNSVLKFIVTAYGVVLMMNGEVTIGVIYAAYLFCNQIINPMQNMIVGINSIESVKSISFRVKALFRNSKDNQSVIEDLPDSKEGIALQNVTVMVDNTLILDHVTHRFLPGKKYLIIGKNGAGKSTLLRLLKKSTREYDGKISVNGEDISSVSLKALSKKISYINESVPLLCDTVRQNIVLFREIDELSLSNIVAKVGLSVPLDRIIKDGDRNISSGETRRIEIARSLVSRPDIIIYDEAISTLDVQTAYAIEKMLLELDEQTVIFVSHNYSNLLIKEYDEIILMDNGRIIDCGTHDELLTRCSLYKRINRIKQGNSYD